MTAGKRINLIQEKEKRESKWEYEWMSVYKNGRLDYGEKGYLSELQNWFPFSLEKTSKVIQNIQTNKRSFLK